MAKNDKESESFDDDDDFEGDVTDPGLEMAEKEATKGKSDALRRIEEIRRIKELREQMNYFDDDSIGDDTLSEL